MKRFVLISSAALLAFAGGVVCMYLGLERESADRQAMADAQHEAAVKSLRQCIYGRNYFHTRGIFPEIDGKLDRWDAHQSEGSITLSYSNGLSRSEIGIRVQCDGKITITENGLTRSATTLDEERCNNFFKRVITSGLLNYSDEVIQLKQDLAHPVSMTMVSDASTVGLHIVVPELEIDKTLSIYAPDIELLNFPDIVEFQLVTEFEKDIQSFLALD